MMKKYSFKDHPRHKEQLKPWPDKWIANAMSTKAMDEEEKNICRKAVRDLYVAAGKEPPPDHRIVFVASPFIGRFAAGFAAAIWYKRRATYDATDDATRDATDAATYAATYDAKPKSLDSWYSIDTEAMVKASKALKVGEFGLKCAQMAWKFWQGGNQWGYWSAMITFFRYVAKLKIDYSKWDAWEKLSVHSGPRFVHEKFCIISDRPKKLLVNDFNQPHCDDGPFCEWRDGSALYALNGVRVPGWIVETPKDKLDPARILKISNAEVRTQAMKHAGLDKFREALKVQVIDSWRDYELWHMTIEGQKIGPYLYMVNPSTGEKHVEGVGDPEKFQSLDTDIVNCQQALAFKWKCSEKEVNRFFLEGGVLT